MINYSVIIPHYKDMANIKRLLNSIPDRADIQVIVVDDNTYSDQTLFFDEIKEGVSSFKKASTQVLFNSKGNSAGACRNVGIDHATGQWLLFADSDDVFLDDAFDVMDQYLEDSYDIVFFTPKTVVYDDSDGTYKHLLCEKYISEYLDGHKEYELNLRYKHYFPWSKMIRRQLQVDHDIRFDETRYSNDVMFSVKSGYYAKKIIASRQMVYRYSLNRPKSLTSIQSMEAFAIRFEVFVNKCLFLKYRMTKQEERKVNGTTGWWLVRAVRSRYGNNMVRLILTEYKRNHLRIRFSLSDVLDREFGRYI